MPPKEINLQFASQQPDSVKGPSQPSTTFENSGLPASYRALYDANPYLNYEYQLGLFDKIGNFFGFRTSEDRTREEYAQRSREYVSQLQSMAREEAYNSEQQQSQRQREAGINPALNGVSAGQAAEMNEQPMSLPDIQRNNQDDVNSIFAGFGNVVNTVLGLGSGILGMQGQSSANLLQRLAGVKGIYDFGKAFGLDLNSEDDVRSLFGHTTNGMTATAFLENRLQKMGFRRREAKKFAFDFQQGLNYRDSLKGQKEKMKDYNELSEQTKQYFSDFGMGTSGTQIQKYTEQALGILSKYSLDAMKLQAKYQKDYYEQVSGTLQGKAENAQNELNENVNRSLKESDYAKIRADYEVTMAKYQTALARLQQATFDKIDGSHPILKSLAMSGLSGLQNIVANPLSIAQTFMPKTPISKKK